MTLFPLHRHKAIHKQRATNHHFLEVILLSLTSLSITLLLTGFHLIHHILEGPQLLALQSPSTIQQISNSVGKAKLQVPNHTSLKSGCDTSSALEVLLEGKRSQRLLKKTITVTTKPVIDVTKHSFVYNQSEDGRDIVYLWVNGTDPIRQKQIQDHINESAIKNAHSPNRFREWNELYYSLILLYKHASSLRRVFVVSSGERPYYANEFPQVIWVNHPEFIPEHILPTFSSFTIQFALYYLLPRLSNPFITMNDDFFIRKPTDLKDYCSKRVWYEEGWSVGASGRDSKGQLDAYLNSYVNANRVLKKVFPQHSRRPLMSHAPTVVRHETLSFIFSNMTADVEESLTRFRSEKSLEFEYMLANVERYRNNREFRFMHGGGDLDFIFGKSSPNDLRRAFLNALKSSKPFLCVNDDIKDPSPEHSIIIHSFFEALIGNNVTENSLVLQSQHGLRGAKTKETK